MIKSISLTPFRTLGQTGRLACQAAQHQERESGSLHLLVKKPFTGFLARLVDIALELSKFFLRGAVCLRFNGNLSDP